MNKTMLASVFLLTLCAAPARAVEHGDKGIIFYDPDVNYDAVSRIIKGINGHLAQRLPDYHLVPVDDIGSLLEQVASHATYAFVSSGSLERLQKCGVTPLLVPESRGSVYYHKVLVDTGRLAQGDLSNKRIAVASAEQGKTAQTRTLDMLKAAHMRTSGATVITTTKDFDALLGLTFDQADAALVTNDSIEVLKIVNPAMVQTLRVLWSSGPILRPLLGALNCNEDSTQRDAVVKAFTDMGSSSIGKGAMESLGIQRWVPYEAAHVGQGE